MSIKVAINRCYGGFSLSQDAITLYRELTKNKSPSRPQEWNPSYDVARDDPDLIATIETLGPQAASGQFSQLRVITIPVDVPWVVQEYDGIEWIAEKHRTWCGEENEIP